MGSSPKVSPQAAGPTDICNAMIEIIIADVGGNVNGFFVDNIVTNPINTK